MNEHTTWLAKEGGRNDAVRCRAEYIPGERFTAVVKAVRSAGVYIEREGVGSGIISPRCWGDGARRAAALARIQTGDQFEVEVVSWHPETKTLSLILPGAESRDEGARKHLGTRKTRRKPPIRLIPLGSPILVDFANILGAFKKERHPASFALPLLEALERQLTELGYKPHLFVERRTLTWAVSNQSSPPEGERLRELFDNRELVTVLQGNADADDALLQLASVVPNSVCVSGDLFRDYSAVYPDLVGSDRVRGFTITKAAGGIRILVKGLALPISLAVPQQTSAEQGQVAVPEASKSLSISELSLAPKPVSPQGCPRRDADVRLLMKMAEKDPRKYFELADLFFEEGGDEGRKRGAKLESLGRKRTKSERESQLRDRRRYAEMRRSDHISTAHLSARRRRFCA